ncbi:STP1 protein, partial [Plasmodium ovale curtisi]
MADDSGYTTITHGTDIGVFLAIIRGDIKNLIRKYGHKNCGLRHEELCEEIKKVIPEKKKIVFEIMDIHGRKKWMNDWNRVRNEFFNKLFEEEGFINVCYPYKKIGNPSLYQLKSRHIQFCKERDTRRAAVRANPLYSECVNYNSWINKETTKLILEFLRNVKDYTLPSVTSYFSTKTQPKGYDPRETYRNSKLDCKKFNPPTRSHPQGPVEKAPISSPHPPKTPNIKQGSKEKNGISVPDVDRGATKIKHDVSIPLRPKSPTVDSGLPSSTKIQTDDAVNGKHTGVKSKAPVPPIKGDSEKKEATLMHPQESAGSTPTVQTKPPLRAKTPPQSQTSSSLPKDTNPPPVIQHLPSSTATTSSTSPLLTVKDTTSSKITPTSPSLTIIPDTSIISGSPSPPDQHFPPLPPATKGHDNVSHTTPGTSSDTHAITHPTISVPSTTLVDSSLSQLQVPVLNASPVVTAPEVLGTPASSSASTITTTFTTTTTALPSVTVSTMSTEQSPIPSTIQVPGIPRIPEAPPAPSLSGTEITTPAVDPQKTPLSSPTTADRDTGAKSPGDILPKPKDPIKAPDMQLSKNTEQGTGHVSNALAPITNSNLQSTIHHIDQQVSPIEVQHAPKIGVVSLASDKSGSSVTAPKVNIKTTPKDDSKVRTNKNDNSNIIPEGIPPLTHIIPTLLLILGTLTLLFQLYKYTPFGFLLGRRRKRKKQNLKRIFEILEKRTYEYPNITMHEWEDHNLGGKTVENDAYIKLLKINRYKQEMEKSKKKNKTTLIEVHMEVLEENKKDEWELHKRDFLEICLRGFINEENETYQKFANSELIVNNIKNEKTIEDIQKQQNLWNSWIENHRNILEEWKKDEWFLILKNEWRKEKNICQEKIYNLEENILNEQETHSI